MIAGCGPSGAKPRMDAMDAASTPRKDAEPADLDATERGDGRRGAQYDAGSATTDAGDAAARSGIGSGNARTGAGACYENIGSGPSLNCLLEASNAPEFQCPDGFTRVDGGTLDAAGSQCYPFCESFGWGSPFCCITSTTVGGFTATTANCYPSNDDGGSTRDAGPCTGSLSTTLVLPADCGG
jgi:hypothetical protein